MTPKVKQFLFDLRDSFESAPRLGEKKDKPEGVRYIQMSDTLVRYFVFRIDKLLDSPISKEQS